MTELLTIAPYLNANGVRTFTVTLRDVAGKKLTVELCAAELQDYAIAQRVILEQTGSLYRYPVAEDKPSTYQNWLWREVVEMRLEAWAHAAGGSVGTNVN